MSRSEGSTCIQTGTNELSESVSAVKTAPRANTANTDWAAAARARFSSPAPKAWEICARNPTPKAATVLPISQLTVTVLPTAAVAAVPSEPTMAVSTYCTAVWISCSSIVGHASESTVGSRAQANMDFFPLLFSMRAS